MRRYFPLKVYGLIYFFLSSFFSISLLATSPEQPVRENAQDLRNFKVHFSIKLEKTSAIYSLESSRSHDFYLKSNVEGKFQLKKISSKLATKLEKDFFSSFTKCQFELPKEQANCDLSIRLTLGVEEQMVCQKEDKKNQEVLSFIQELNKFF